MSLKGRSQVDCVRIYLNCTKKWPYFGASLFQAKVSPETHTSKLTRNLLWNFKMFSSIVSTACVVLFIWEPVFNRALKELVSH